MDAKTLIESMSLAARKLDPAIKEQRENLMTYLLVIEQLEMCKEREEDKKVIGFQTPAK